MMELGYNKLLLEVLGVYLLIGFVFAFSCKIWFLKTYDIYHPERINPFANWLGSEPVMTVFIWPSWLIVAFVEYFLYYLPKKVTNNL